MSLRSTAVLVLLASMSSCTTLRPADAGPRDGGGSDTRLDAPLDTPSETDVGPSDAGTDAPDARTCTPACVGSSSLRPCEGDAPVVCALGCVAGPPAHCGEMVITNVEGADTLPLLAATTAATGTIDSTACRWTAGSTTPMGTVVTMDDGGDACVFRFESLTIAATSSVRAVGFLPVILISEGPLTLLGELSADSTRGGSPLMGAGDGTGGTAGTGGVRASLSGSGGGGGGFGTAGGRGGDVWSGSGAGGLGGGATPMPTLEPLVGGGIGGAGGTSAMSGPRGGRAGGGIQLSSRTRVVIQGYLGAAGSGGDGGDGSGGGGGGGGSGGGLLIEAPEVVLSGDTRINVAGGGGGSGPCVAGSSTAGQDGAEEEGAPAGGTVCSFMSGGAGGAGAGGTSAAGPGSRGSGGGGGAGVVRFRARTLPSLDEASLNPRESAGVYLMGDVEVR